MVTIWHASRSSCKACFQHLLSNACLYNLHYRAACSASALRVCVATCDVWLLAVTQGRRQGHLQSVQQRGTA